MARQPTLAAQLEGVEAVVWPRIGRIKLEIENGAGFGLSTLVVKYEDGDEDRATFDGIGGMGERKPMRYFQEMLEHILRNKMMKMERMDRMEELDCPLGAD